MTPSRRPRPPSRLSKKAGQQIQPVGLKPDAGRPLPCAMGGCLGPVAADRHAAPPAAMILTNVMKPHGACRAFTVFDVAKIGRADEVTQGLGEGKQQRLWGPPAAFLPPPQVRAVRCLGPTRTRS